MRFLTLTFLALALPALAKESKYDDGTPDGTKALGEVGYGIWFDGPVDATCVRIFAARGKARGFDVAVTNRDGTVLAEGAFDASAIPEKAGWARRALTVKSEEGVLVVVTFSDGEEGEMSVDKNDERHSTYYYGGNHHPFNDGNWMIRLSTGDGAKPVTFPRAELPAGTSLRADAGEAVELRDPEACPAVRFERPERTTLAGIEVYGARVGRLSRTFRVAICDEDLRVVRTVRVACGQIGVDEKWVPIAIPAGETPRVFWLLLDLGNGSADRVSVGVCRNPAAVSAEGYPDGVFRRAAPGEAWMIRARLVPGDEPAARAVPPPPEDAAVAAEVAKKFFKALEFCDRDRFLSVLSPDAAGFDAVREDEHGILEGFPHRRLAREVARDIGPDRATLVFATLRAPLLWDPPEAFRAASPPNRPIAPGPNLWRLDGPGRHAPPALLVLHLARTADGWKLAGWDDLDPRDAAWGKGLLKAAPPLDDVLTALAKSRAAQVQSVDDAVRALDDADARARLLPELARTWAEEGDFARWETIAKELPKDVADVLRTTSFFEGTLCVAAGPEEKPLGALVAAADTLLAALEKRFALKPPGTARLRFVLQSSDDSGFVAHPGAWAYPEIVWFATEADLTRPIDVQSLALAIADACVRFYDDADQLRRWLAAGMIAEASLAGKETPAGLAGEVKDILPSRNVVGGNLRIFVEASRRWGDAALGRAIAIARAEGAYRHGRNGRQLYLDELAKALAKETGADAQVAELFRRS